jgi:hypothetical protein
MRPKLFGLLECERLLIRASDPRSPILTENVSMRGGRFDSIGYLVSPRPSHFDRDQIGFRTESQPIWMGERLVPAAIPDHKDVSAWLDRPAHASVAAEIPGLAVVLDEASKDQVGTPRVG